MYETNLTFKDYCGAVVIGLIFSIPFIVEIVKGL